MNGTRITAEFHFDQEGHIIRLVTNDVSRPTQNGMVHEKRMVKYKFYRKQKGYLLPWRLYNFWLTSKGWISDEDLRLDEIIYR